MPKDARHRSLSATPWAPPASWPELPIAGQVHLWRLRLTTTEEQLFTFKSWLTAEEYERANRFYFVRDREKYVIGRARLRQLLGHYLDASPANIRLRYGKYGKPRLSPDQGGNLRFNLSHSGGHALYGFTSSGQIGVDLEVEDPDVEIARLASRFFSPDEAAQVLALPAEERAPAFFRVWTRKEAFLKAKGTGLGLPLDGFSVTVNSAQPVRLKAIDWSPAEVSHWALASFEVAPRVAGAVAVRGTIDDLAFYDLA